MKTPYFSKLSFQARLIITMALMLLLLIAIAVSSLLSIQSMGKAVNEIIYMAHVNITQIAELQRLFHEANYSLYNYLLNGDTIERERFAEISKKIDRSLFFIQSISMSSEGRKSIASVQEEWQQVRNMGETLLRFSDSKTIQITAEDMALFYRHVGWLNKFLETFQKQANSDFWDHQRQADNTIQSILFFTILISSLGVVIAIVATTLLLYSIILPIRLLKKGAISFSNGDLSHRVPLASGDELGELAKVFNTMAETLEKDQAALEELAIHDGLTGLYNHREFQRRLQVEIERSQRYQHPVSLLMLDIDHFKVFNDTYGHQAGDHVLRALATQMRQEARAVDCASRYGGEEFTIILPEMSASNALAAAERFRKSIVEKSITLDGGQLVNVTVSIGVATFPEDASSREELITSADRALYAAKAAGRNRVLRAV